MTPEEIEAIRAQRTERAQRRAARRIAWAESREKKAEEAYQKSRELGSVIPFGQPILVGHHSERGHRALIGRIQSAATQSVEHDAMAKHHREKAENILKYGSRVAGDAERAREIMRAEQDKVITVGTRVYDFAFGAGVVMRVNRKTYTIQFDRGCRGPRDKTYCKPE